jgi:isoquinoline 1-oxidoreductase alpha subunit
MIKLTVNGKAVEFDGDASMPLLWFLRDLEGLTGTKFGCGVAQCGACTVHVAGNAVRSCVLPVAAAAGTRVTTIEGLTGPIGAALQKAWIAIDVPQCGYCQTGQIMSAAVLLRERQEPTDSDIDACMGGNVCRCATYQRIRNAIHDAARFAKEGR